MPRYGAHRVDDLIRHGIDDCHCALIILIDTDFFARLRRANYRLSGCDAVGLADKQIDAVTCSGLGNEMRIGEVRGLVPNKIDERIGVTYGNFHPTVVVTVRPFGKIVLRPEILAVGNVGMRIDVVGDSVIIPVVGIDALVGAFDQVGAGDIVAVGEKFKLGGEKKLGEWVSDGV